MPELAKGRIFPPWSPEQVAALNRFQQCKMVHPFTCGYDRTDFNHLDGEGVLLATPNGWECPYCDYRQGWAHAFMAQPELIESPMLGMTNLLIFSFSR